MTNFLLLICIALLAALHWRLGGSRARFQERDSVSLRQLPKPDGDSPPEIRIQVLNPLEVAEKESAFGRFLGKVSPSLISRQVYLKTAETISHEFRQRGIRARIDIHYPDKDKPQSSK